jgi:hypothetical protein
LENAVSTVTGLTTTSYDVPSSLLSNCTTYYWGVTAINANGSTASSPVQFSFTTPNPADFNGDGFVTGEDFDLFDQAFEAGDMSADFNGDGFLTGEDFDLFVQAFEIGDSASDFNGDGFITGEDFDLFVQAFEAGDMRSDFNGDEFLTGEDFDQFVQAFEAGLEGRKRGGSAVKSRSETHTVHLSCAVNHPH